MRVPIAIELPTAQLTLLPSAEGAVAELELRVAAIDERGGRSEIPVLPMRRGRAGEDRTLGATARYETLLELRRACATASSSRYTIRRRATCGRRTVEVKP
jgi:hypothetical protein